MVGALSIIRFRTAVKDVRDATFIFWAIAAGIGCGVSQYSLIAIGSIFILIFLILTKQVVDSKSQLLVIQASDSAQNEIEAAVSDYFGSSVHRIMKNLSQGKCEIVYSIKEGALQKGKEKNLVDISQFIMKIDGVISVNLSEQQDDISR
jgi:uncharacterized membrane protein YhiD involved in acid resistance